MRKKQSAPQPLICTIEHSTHPLNEFASLLKINAVTHVWMYALSRVPGRTLSSTKKPYRIFCGPLAINIRICRSLADCGMLIRIRLTVLGAMRLFADMHDYMQTPEFAMNVQNVMALAAHERCALMCAEAVRWRCHRSLIADALTLRGMCVEDIIGAKGRKLHLMTPWAKTDGLKISYPPEPVFGFPDVNGTEH